MFTKNPIFAKKPFGPIPNSEQHHNRNTPQKTNPNVYKPIKNSTPEKKKKKK
jgi:hypothetical protein